MYEVNILKDHNTASAYTSYINKKLETLLRNGFTEKPWSQLRKLSKIQLIRH